MTARIVPRPRTDDSPLTLPDAKDAEPQALAYAMESKIYVLPDMESGQSVQIAERSDKVRALAVYKGELVDAGNYKKILYTVTGKLIKRRSSSVGALAVHNGELVDASDRKIRYTETDDLIRQRTGFDWTHAFAIHNGELVDASYDTIRYTETDRRIKLRPPSVSAIAVYGGRLVDARAYGQIRYTDTDEFLTQDFRIIDALAVCNGKLVDSSDNQIRYTETDRLILAADGKVTALCPIPLSLAERLAQGRRPK